jgi:hypothetical protein
MAQSIWEQNTKAWPAKGLIHSILLDFPAGWPTLIFLYSPIVGVVTFVTSPIVP